MNITATNYQHHTSQNRATTFLGRQVSTTDGRTGTVEEAYNHQGKVNLIVRQSNGIEFGTDSEHANIVRHP